MTIESQEQWEEKLLGILAIYKEVFGRKALTDIMKPGQMKHASTKMVVNLGSKFDAERGNPAPVYQYI